MKVFLAGATGVIGRPLTSQLLAANHEVGIPLVSLSSPMMSPVFRHGYGLGVCY